MKGHGHWLSQVGCLRMKLWFPFFHCTRLGSTRMLLEVLERAPPLRSRIQRPIMCHTMQGPTDSGNPLALHWATWIAKAQWPEAAWIWGLWESFMCFALSVHPLELLHPTLRPGLYTYWIPVPHTHRRGNGKSNSLMRWLLVHSPSTLTSVGHQWTVPTNISYIQWLSLAKPILKVASVGRYCSLLAKTSNCGHAINLLWPLRILEIYF